jgi:hypothetical protein
MAAIPARLDVTAVVQNGQIQVDGATNLPDGTDLMISVYRRETHYSAGGNVSVKGGAFKTGPYTDNGGPLSGGQYTVVVSTPIWDVQPAAVKVPLGARYSNFAGPLVSKTQFGTIIARKISVAVPGHVDAAADAAARKTRDAASYEQLRRNCYTIPDAAARMTHQTLSEDRRQTMIAECLADAEADHKKRR